MSKRVWMRVAAVLMLMALVLPGVGAASAASPSTGAAKKQVVARKHAKKQTASKASVKARVLAALKKGVKPATLLKKLRAYLAKQVKAGKMSQAAAKARYTKLAALLKKAIARKSATKRPAAKKHAKKASA